MRDAVLGFVERWGDETLAGIITALTLVQVALSDASDPARLAAAAIAVVLGAAASRRSRAPLLLLGLVLLVTVLAFLPGLALSTISAYGLFLLLAVYSAAAHTSDRDVVLGGAMTLVICIATGVAGDPGTITAEEVVFLALLFGAPWVAGRAVWQRRLNDRQLAREKARAGVAIIEERARIARELHDVVAHAISVMVLQARGGRRVLQREPDAARDAFAVIERTGQESLEEMRRLLGMLRRDDEVPALAPEPSLKELGRLIQQVEVAGLPVQVAVEGEPRELPPGVDLSAFRIVQEGLTNSLKHAGSARARVVLRYHPHELELEVTDDGAGTGETPGGGYGLIGMRERVSVYGGELHAGRRPEGGYVLRARLPLGSPRRS